jgi:hypothetical protein
MRTATKDQQSMGNWKNTEAKSNTSIPCDIVEELDQLDIGLTSLIIALRQWGVGNYPRVLDASQNADFIGKVSDGK